MNTSSIKIRRGNFLNKLFLLHVFISIFIKPRPKIILIIIVMTFEFNSFGQVPIIKTPKPTVVHNIPIITLVGIPSRGGNVRNNSSNNANIKKVLEDIKNHKKRQAAIKNRNSCSDLPRSISYSLPDRNSQKGTEHFREALKKINDMLEGKTKLNLKKAVFIVENAYYGNRMNYKQFNKAIQEAVNICRLKIKEYGTSNDLIKNLTIFNLITDTTRVKLQGTEKTLTRFPMKYDFNDCDGKLRFDNMFVSKLIATHSGQCHSMPLYFKILSQELGSESHITYSPRHSFIRFKSRNDNWYNAELTSGVMMSDAAVLEGGFIKSESLKSGIYMRALGLHETVACTINDLMNGYIRKYGYDCFIQKAINVVKKYYPNQLHTSMIEANLQTVTMTYIARQKGRPPIEIFKRDSLANESLEKMHELYSKLDNLGYEDMPDKHYQKWLKSLKKAKLDPANQKNFINQMIK